MATSKDPYYEQRFFDGPISGTILLCARRPPTFVTGNHKGEEFRYELDAVGPTQNIMYYSERPLTNGEA
jgi:hypothetical protein